MSSVDASFKMVVLGDSILWGQGLYDSQKIHTLTIEGLTRRGLEVECVFLAHSGAVIGEPDHRSNLPRIDGEVPVGEPTVFEQIDELIGTADRDEVVKLVLISGGVNDVDSTRILNLANRHLDEQIEDAFYRKMKLLIEKAYHCFPNAIIMVTGYYQVFSDSSEKTLAHNALKAMGFNVPLLPDAVGELVIDVLGSLLTDALIERCAHFCDAAHHSIREVIVDLTGIMPEASGRIFFADPKFKDDNAVGAPDTFLYGIDPDLSPQDPDEIANRRAKACATHADRLTPIERIAGPRASVGHPNPVGAQRYAEAILADLRYTIPILFEDESA